MNKLFVISGSSGVGKGTLLKELLNNNPQFKLSVSCTTRKMREGEVEGVNYFYLSRQEFLEAVECGDFLEWAEFSGNCYGTKKSFIDKCLKNDETVILEIDTQGALQVKEKMPEAVLIFIAPPSFEILENRLRGRKTETEEAILERLKFVKLEMENSKKFNYTVVNEDLLVAVSELEGIIKNEQK